MTTTISGSTGVSSDTGFSCDGISFADNAPSNSLIVNSSGSVGIGTNSPTAKLQVSNGTVNVDINPSGSVFYFGTSNNYPVIFNQNNSERMRIDSSGNLLVGTTSGAQQLVVQGDAGGCCALKVSVNGTGGIDWYNASGTYVTSVVVNSTSVAYNTSSDYRLKENIQPMQHALSVVQQLNPVTYNWKADGSDGQGFIAHELQAVVPDCVTGEKDAVDAEGNPVYQGIDTSFLVATLAKAIQELSAKNDALESRIAALEAK